MGLGLGRVRARIRARGSMRHGVYPIGLRGVLGVNGELHVAPLRRTRGQPGAPPHEAHEGGALLGREPEGRCRGDVGGDVGEM